MKYFSCKSVANAYNGFKSKPAIKVWGLLALLRQIDSVIFPGQTYEINCYMLSNYLEELFNLKNRNKYSDNGSSWFVKFSYNWKDIFNRGGKTFNVFDIIVWAYRFTPLPDNISSEGLVEMFANDYHLDLNDIKNHFSTNSRPIEYDEGVCENDSMIKELNLLGVDTSKNCLKADGSSTEANAGELSRGPYAQTLYAALDVREYFIISQTRLDDLYPFSDVLFIPSHDSQLSSEMNVDIISALRTKPFLLLAGISGTGKSRKVLELAYQTCVRDGMHDKDDTAPSNYMLIPVKPNWHDSTELLGYYSSITGKYVLTDFIRFVWKASIHKNVPYFLCLDEMNLAPVEQYFAEYLSILETRKRVYNKTTKKWEIITAELLPKKTFENLPTEIRTAPKNNVITLSSITSDVSDEIKTIYQGEDIQIINFLKENGLRLPENLFVIGTVNMDDTTHQFSRKVIDRAFTIEMNGEKLDKMFNEEDTLCYLNDPMNIDKIKPLYVNAQEVLKNYPDDAETIKEYVPELLERINGKGIFENTPFRVSYRVQNELVLYYAAIRPQGHLDKDEIKTHLNEAFMAILLEKILPRVEGDEKAMKCDERGDSAILQNIQRYIDGFVSDESEPAPIYNLLKAKLTEMNERVKNSYFTSFFS